MLKIARFPFVFLLVTWGCLKFGNLEDGGVSSLWVPSPWFQLPKGPRWAITRRAVLGRAEAEAKKLDDAKAWLSRVMVSLPRGNSKGKQREAVHVWLRGSLFAAGVFAAI